jgi:hypothetical protein
VKGVVGVLEYVVYDEWNCPLVDYMCPRWVTTAVSS